MMTTLLISAIDILGIIKSSREKMDKILGISAPDIPRVEVNEEVIQTDSVFFSFSQFLEVFFMKEELF